MRSQVNMLKINSSASLETGYGLDELEFQNFLQKLVPLKARD